MAGILAWRRPGRALPVALLVIGALTIASPVYGAKPVRTVQEPSDPFVIPAGLGCSFDVLWDTDPSARIVDTQFADGRLARNTNGDPTLINLETGASFHHKARYHSLDRIDPLTNEDLFDVSGQFVAQFYPGDQGPTGVVAWPGALIRFTGNQHWTIDLNTGVVTAFSYTGQMVDICALLA